MEEDGFSYRERVTRILDEKWNEKMDRIFNKLAFSGLERLASITKEGCSVSCFSHSPERIGGGDNNGEYHHPDDSTFKEEGLRSAKVIGEQPSTMMEKKRKVVFNVDDDDDDDHDYVLEKSGGNGEHHQPDGSISKEEGLRSEKVAGEQPLTVVSDVDDDHHHDYVPEKSGGDTNDEYHQPADGSISEKEGLSKKVVVWEQPPTTIEKKRKVVFDANDDHDQDYVPDLVAECSFHCPKKKCTPRFEVFIQERMERDELLKKKLKKQGSMEKDSSCSSDSDYSPYLPNKKSRSGNGIVISEPISKEERLRREKALKKAMIDDHESETPTLPLPPWLKQGTAATCDSSYFSPKKKKRFVNGIPAHCQSKKTTNIPYRGPATPPALPIKFRNIITELEGTEIQMVIQKPLTASDVKHSQGRLSIPLSQITAVNFLTEKEYAYLNNQSKGIAGMDIEIIDTKHEIRTITLKRWNLSKGNGKTNPWYVLNSTWNELVRFNELECGNIVQLWSFRVRSELHLAIVLVKKGDAAAATADVDDHGNDNGIGSSSTASQTSEETQEEE